MPAGVCSVVKSKPRRVQRCISNGSLDVQGSVIVERVWLTDGDSLPTDHLPGSADNGCLGSRKSHLWSLYTNLSSAQECLKCEKRILMKRAAYKCTVCKKLSHLKCAVIEHPVATRTRSKVKCPEQKQSATGIRQTQLEIIGTQNQGSTSARNKVSSVLDKENCYHVEETDSLAEFVMEENNCKADCSTQTRNTTVQSQAKQTLSNMRTNIVRSCKSIKKKVEKLRDKLNCDCDDKANNDIDSKQDIETGLDCDDEETAVTAQEAWLFSPVRKRLRSRLQEDSGSQSEEAKADWISYRRNTRKRRRFDGYAVELTDMNDRLEMVERKINDLEQTIPLEVEEWKKLHKKFQITDEHGNINVDTEETPEIHETTAKVPLPEETLCSSSSVATSDEMRDTVPVFVYSFKGDRNRHGEIWNNPQADLSGREESFPSAIPPRLLIGEQRDTSGSNSELQQTSTPVTNREISFQSASKKYEHSQVTHKNITHIKLDKEIRTDKDTAIQNNTETVADPDTVAEKNILSPNQVAVKSFLQRRHSSNTESGNRSSNAETDSQTEAKILSPNQIAVQQFLERRRSNPSSEFLSDSLRQSNQGVENTENTVNGEEAGCTSPSNNIASSTFTNGNGDVVNPLFNMSPIPYTCRNGFENGAVSFSRSSEESKTYDRRASGLDKSAFNVSALSYTFRNDSSMIHTDGNENLPGFSDNLPRLRQEPSTGHSGSPRRDFEVVQQLSVAYCSNQPAMAAASTLERLSLTNVTEFSPDYPNSFADYKDTRYNRDAKTELSSTRSRFGDEFLTQIKSGVKLRDTSLEGKECKDETSTDHLSEDSELKMVYDKIMRERQDKNRQDGIAHFHAEEVKIDETGDNGHRGVKNMVKRKDPYSKLGSKYQDLFRFCEPEEWGLVVNQCKESAKSLQTNKIQKPGPPLPPKPVKAVKKTSEEDIQAQPGSPTSEPENKDGETDVEKDINENEIQTAYQVDTAGNNNIASLEINENRNIPETKSKTFPRTAKKHYDCSHFGNDETYEKAASYAGGIDIDRRSVHTETSSLDRYGDAKYHFLHEKGMIKICSPRLELVSESPSSKRKVHSSGNPDNHISEEDTNTDGSSSDISGVVIDNEFHLNEYRQRLDEFNDIANHKDPPGKTNNETEKRLSDDKRINQTIESYNSELEARQQDLANEILENCLEIIDNNQAALDHVFDWINKDCNNNSDTSVKAELDALVGTEGLAQMESENGFQSPVDDSVYYSFQGQSEEIIKVMTGLETDSHPLPLEDELMKDFLVAVMNENLTVVTEFFRCGNALPDVVLKEALDFSIQQQNRALAKELLDYACMVLQNMDVNDIVDIWPAYTLEDDWNPVFVVLRKSDSDSEWAEFVGYKVFNRKYNHVSEEADIVMNNKLVRNNPLSFDDFEKLKEAVDKINLQDYSNITLIDICPCRSRKGGEEIFLETCIAIHCLVKGLVPFHEKPFPKIIMGTPVDVREGYFSLGVHRAPHWQTDRSTESCTEISDTTETGSTSGEGDSIRTSTSLGSGTEGERSGREGEVSGTNNDVSEKTDVDGEIVSSDNEKEVDYSGDVEVDYHQEAGAQKTDNQPQEAGKTTYDDTNSLRMGACVCGVDSSATGTLGGFITVDDCHLGFLTCAHVVGSEIRRLVSVVETGVSSQSVCGVVTKSVRKPGSPTSTGVDAALVTITHDQPVTMDFVSLTDAQLTATGFSSDNPPRFQKGKIIPLKELAQCWRSEVIKVGAKTGLTRGSLYSYGLYVRRQHQDGIEEHGPELFNQLEIIPVSDSTKFFDQGDSGALVFMHLNDQDLYCIGLAVGCTSYGSCIVTPIEHVFNELKLPAQFYCP